MNEIDEIREWPPLKKAIWNVITSEELNAKYVNAWEFTEKLYTAALTRLDELQGVDVDDLAQFIRKVDGNNSMGAGQLAEAIADHLHAQGRILGKGYVAVPIEPTEDMISVGTEADIQGKAAVQIYKAMIAKAAQKGGE